MPTEGSASTRWATLSHAASASRTDQPRPCRPSTTWPRQASSDGAAETTASSSPSTAASSATLSFSSITIFCAPLSPMPGTAVRRLTSSVCTARRKSPEPRTDTMASASFGPTPEAVCASSNAAFSPADPNPKRVSESSRTTSDVWRVASSPGRSPAAVPGVTCTRRPIPPTSTTQDVAPACRVVPFSCAIIASPWLPRPPRRNDWLLPRATPGTRRRRGRRPRRRAWAGPRAGGSW